MLRNSLLIILTFLSFSSIGQVHDQNIRQLVLRKGIMGKMYTFGKWSENGDDETHLKYLGKITSKSGRIFKIVTSSWFWGYSHRATSRILVFDASNRYLGNYYVSVVNDLPTKLKNKNLIFQNSPTIVSLEKGLPKQFFLESKDGTGDIYSFETD